MQTNRSEDYRMVTYCNSPDELSPEDRPPPAFIREANAPANTNNQLLNSLRNCLPVY